MRQYTSSITVENGPLGDLRGYAAIPGAFESGLVFDVIGAAPPYDLKERALRDPFRKDYDALEDPRRWPELFDVTNWILFGAFDGYRRIGGAIGAFDTPGVDMLEGRRDLVVLWDLRVAPEARGQGVGSALFRAVEESGARRACTELKVETQNVNVQACRLYRARGCTLAEARRGAYRDLPEEVQLIWRKRLAVWNFSLTMVNAAQTLPALARDYAKGMTSIRGRRVQRLLMREFAGADTVQVVQADSAMPGVLGISTSGAAFCATDGRGRQASVVKWLHGATQGLETHFDLLKDSLLAVGTRSLPLADLLGPAQLRGLHDALQSANQLRQPGRHR